MADNTDNNGSNGTGVLRGLLDELPVDRLKDELQQSFSTLSGKALETAGGKIGDLSDRLTDVADGGGFMGKAAKEGMEEAAEGGSPVKGALKGGLGGVKDKVKEKLGGGKSGGEQGTRSTNIIEEIDVGVPVRLAYNQWTQFQDYSNFMKKVDTVDQEDEVKVNFKAQVFWSHRKWEATILEQVPDEKIVWRSKGEKGHVDGAVTFHELAPNLTRILVVLEYYPQGFFERTGNLWRAQGRRARLELKHFRRHVMTQVAQNPDEVEGWRGEIHDGELERDHDEVVADEQEREESPGLRGLLRRARRHRRGRRGRGVRRRGRVRRGRAGGRLRGAGRRRRGRLRRARRRRRSGRRVRGGARGRVRRGTGRRRARSAPSTPRRRQALTTPP